MKGHVRKRGNKWSFVIDIGRDESTGKRRQKRFSGFNTKKEAEKALAQKINELHTGQFVDATKETVGEYLSVWLEDKKAQVRPGTWKSYRWLVNRMVEHIGKVKLADLKPQHLQKMYNQLQKGERPLSARSVLHAHLVIQEALDRAMKWGMIHRNVAEAVDAPRPKKVEMSVWNAEQIRQFLEVAKEDRHYIAFLLAITTGMRKGEILGLRWKDIDLERGTLSVRQTFTRAEKGHDFQEPKSSSGLRSIALPPGTIEALRAHKIQQSKEKLKAGSLYQDVGMVVATSIGTPVLSRNLDRTWFRLMKKAGVPRIRFHDLRHTHATLMLKQGVHPKIVSERLGHSNIGITLDTYSHVLPGLQEAAAKQFDESLFGTQKEKKNTL
ncbi:tyrosine-type recombinase/integrase [Aneurinibacillus thermoaerophilus]|uniref:site-specific integrase n=1 Tax=Aneurinibacillus thermoaerophilus TaxID=143495 RepID=UPI002E1B4587|nr:tyrosine-type recombinase/integrase [Aneurinibacillus thermoaerophilus]MED0680652.1 tyrosine-type recombinase/integrase [Aneurinibacillus thermoaerophilus]MED0739008.1 tyrosine-type recombinase/integrase [Aneurinibacillus thermoaerophilus]MED0766211.1 tyrosine-type recombinase/integrase [Aneurinibacillus thermoaerophilus]